MYEMLYYMDFPFTGYKESAMSYLEGNDHCVLGNYKYGHVRYNIIVKHEYQSEGDKRTVLKNEGQKNLSLIHISEPTRPY